MKITRVIRAVLRKAYGVILLSAVSIDAFAASAGQPMPWEGPIQKITDSITGPVAKSLALIVIVMAGLGIAFGEAGSGVRKIMMVVLGLAIAFSAASIIASVYNPSSGLAF
ncbi:MAG: conjugal transfer protein TrbC [Gammaproteobacteria bacterium]|nr:conjugal transfer protein TrbC [Gammaproteobacteria bacterium]